MPPSPDSAWLKTPNAFTVDDNMTQNKVSSLIGVSFALGIVTVFFAGVTGISTPFVAFSYFVLAIGLLLIAIAEVGLFLLIVLSALIEIKNIIQRKKNRSVRGDFINTSGQEEN